MRRESIGCDMPMSKDEVELYSDALRVAAKDFFLTLNSHAEYRCGICNAKALYRDPKPIRSDHRYLCDVHYVVGARPINE
jgi:hypothetical protein